MGASVFLSGLPGTGKTTVLSKIALKGWKAIPEFFDRVPDYVYTSHNESVASRIRAQDWVLTQNIRKHELAREFLSKNYSVVVDRSPVDILAYSLMLGDEIYKDSIDKMLSTNWILGSLYFFNIPIQIACQRLIDRDSLDKSTTIEWLNFFENLSRSYNQLMSSTYATSSGSINIIDTEKHSAEQISRDIISTKNRDAFDFNKYLKGIVNEC